MGEKPLVGCGCSVLLYTLNYINSNNATFSTIQA